MKKIEELQQKLEQITKQIEELEKETNNSLGLHILQVQKDHFIKRISELQQD